jgi:hypothetical protein
MYFDLYFECHVCNRAFVCFVQEEFFNTHVWEAIRHEYCGRERRFIMLSWFWFRVWAVLVNEHQYTQDCFHVRTLFLTVVTPHFYSAHGLGKQIVPTSWAYGKPAWCSSAVGLFHHIYDQGQWYHGPTAASFLPSLHVGHVSVRLLNFWLKDPEFWFAQVDSVFCSTTITCSLTKYGHCLAKLLTEVITSIHELVTKSIPVPWTTFTCHWRLS